VTTFRVWAPDANAVSLVHGDEDRAMDQRAGGWWQLGAFDIRHGDDYAFRVDGGDPRPDPRSRWQPDGVHSASRVYDHDRYEWHDGGWRGVPLAGSVLYELHVGTFTEEGTLSGALARLDHLVELGVDAVELLPLAAFDGPRGWGYDGVALYAVHEPYGGPDGLKGFVDACHDRGIGVVLDVVYNHLGPSGNYLSEFGPYFTDRHTTPWGTAVNLDAPGSDEVRAWILDNAVGWLRDFHLDGLRLDAIHELVDTRAFPLLEELGERVHELAAQVGKPLFLVAESDLNDPRTVTAAPLGLGLDAQWSDDVHHALHATLTGERHGYYSDFGSLETLSAALSSAFVHAGTWSSFRQRTHGRSVDRRSTPGSRFVAYLQDHDQVGNRATGDRLAASLTAGLLKVGAALLLCSPYTPMLFMGEEWAASTPWQYFTSFPDRDLAAAVREGRRAEFATHGWAAEDIPDPQDLQTFQSSRLDWDELDDDPHAGLLDWYRRLIALRRERSELTHDRLDEVRSCYDEEARWFVLYRGRLAVVCNLASVRLEVPVEGTPTSVIAASEGGFVYRTGVVEVDPESTVIVELAEPD
jgi:maltooligosyltrehalose trehalohydrolase